MARMKTGNLFLCNLSLYISALGAIRGFNSYIFNHSTLNTKNPTLKTAAEAALLPAADGAF